MFGRKKEDDADRMGAEKRPEMILPILLKPKLQPGGQVSPAAKPALSHPESARRSTESAAAPQLPPPIMPALRARESAESASKMLIVGREIALAGEINACDKLVVEGRVEANLADCREIEIASTGTFKGSAEVEIADINGTFDGKLTVRDHLVVRASGRVTGTLRYRQVEIERGGEICGDVQVIKSSETGSAT